MPCGRVPRCRGRPDAAPRRNQPRPADRGIHHRPETPTATARSRARTRIPRPIAMRKARDSAAHYQGASGVDLRAYLRSSRMDFLQHFLLGQPVEDNGQDSGRPPVLADARRHRRRGTDRRRGRGDRAERAAAVPGRPDDRRHAGGRMRSAPPAGITTMTWIRRRCWRVRRLAAAARAALVAGGRRSASSGSTTSTTTA